MARTPRRDDGPARPGDEGVGAATRALADATAALTTLLRQQVVQSVGAELSDAVATSLREAARGLSEASETVERHTGGRRADERRQARVDRTRSELLAAAARVFAARGYEGASVGDIAAEAGYTKGALYAHFGSKSELFVTLARERILCDDVPTGDGAPGGVAHAPRAPLVDELAGGMLTARDDPAMLLALEVLAYCVRHPESRAELAPLVETSLERLAGRARDDRIARAAAAGSVPGARDVTDEDRDTALAILAVANMTPMVDEIRSLPRTLDSAGARILARLLAGRSPQD